MQRDGALNTPEPRRLIRLINSPNVIHATINEGTKRTRHATECGHQLSYPVFDWAELGMLQQARSAAFQTLISKHNHSNALFMFIRRTEQAHAPTIDSLSAVKGSQ